ncbi:MAG: nucleotide exchange factor GrpE [Candidatus Peregrinibacteria bacterium]|nr:nucleotide exchange factor GrpE [Candidatus Peregrinibacteria bacterium]MDZ4245002.1 nucleotide exchange factor GrpE [Candidatus Gracilibacteria bacterium]
MNTQQDDNQVEPLDEIQQKIKEQEELNEQAEIDAKIAQLTNLAQQATADLANFKRRSEEEKKAFAQFATANLVLELLQVTDNFDRALQNVPEEIKGNEWHQGIQGIDQQFHGILQKQGVAPIQAIGQKLDLNLHEALMQGPGEKDIILEELEKGYMMGTRILRPTKVKVGNGEAA